MFKGLMFVSVFITLCLYVGGTLMMLYSCGSLGCVLMKKHDTKVPNGTFIEDDCKVMGSYYTCSYYLYQFKTPRCTMFSPYYYEPNSTIVIYTTEHSKSCSEYSNEALSYVGVFCLVLAATFTAGIIFAIVDERRFVKRIQTMVRRDLPIELRPPPSPVLSAPSTIDVNTL